MSFARDVYTASAAQTDFTISFPYQAAVDVLVYEDGVLQTVGAANDYILSDATTVQFNAGLVGGETIVILRSTSQTVRTVNYTAGALSEADMDNDSIQAFYMAQESIDIANNALVKGTDDNWTAATLQIKNVVDGTADQDAITKAQLDAAVLAGGAGNVPTPSNPADDGKALLASGGAYAWTDPDTVEGFLNEITSTTADANEGPVLTLARDSASPAANDVLGALTFQGKNDAAEDVVYGKLRVKANDETDGTEDGQPELWSMVAGTLTRLFWAPSGLVMEGATGGDQGAGTINATGVFVNGGAVGVGSQDLFIPAGAMIPTSTNGAASGLTEHATNDVMMQTLDFDQTTEEHAQFSIVMPKRYDLGTFTFEAEWTIVGGAGNVVWGLQALAVGNDDAWDQAFGTEVTVTDSLIGAGDIHLSPTSGAVTPAGTPADGDRIIFQISRVAADGSDTLNIDALLTGVRLHWTSDAANDD